MDQAAGEVGAGQHQWEFQKQWEANAEVFQTVSSERCAQGRAQLKIKPVQGHWFRKYILGHWPTFKVNANVWPKTEGLFNKARNSYTKSRNSSSLIFPKLRRAPTWKNKNQESKITVRLSKECVSSHLWAPVILRLAIRCFTCRTSSKKPTMSGPCSSPSKPKAPLRSGPGVSLTSRVWVPEDVNHLKHEQGQPVRAWTQTAWECVQSGQLFVWLNTKYLLDKYFKTRQWVPLHSTSFQCRGLSKYHLCVPNA